MAPSGTRAARDGSDRLITGSVIGRMTGLVTGAAGRATGWWDRRRLFSPPPASLYTDRDSTYFAGGSTYTEYNYLGSWPARTVKTRHFEAALRETSDAFGTATVIDMGCADGAFLPSLAARFRGVIGVDRRPEFIDIARDVVARMGLSNVRLICNEGCSAEELSASLLGSGATIVFLLETLEHVGEAERFYESKVDFVEQLLDLMPAGARVVISVPVMIGPTFLLLRGVLRVTGRFREPISRRNLWRATLLGRTEQMEASWRTDDHHGFNHRRLISALRGNGLLVRHRSIGFSQLIVVTRPAATTVVTRPAAATSR